MTQDNREKQERTIQDVLKEINDNLELIIKTQKEMMQTLDNYIEHKEKMIEEYKKSIKCGLEEY
jgi:DNA-binding ferritin-like protein